MIVVLALARIVGEDQGIEIEENREGSGSGQRSFEDRIAILHCPSKKEKIARKVEGKLPCFFYYFFFESLNGGEERIPLKEARI